MKKAIILGVVLCALGMLAGCKRGLSYEAAADSTQQSVVVDELQITDEQWRERWLNGELLDRKSTRLNSSHTDSSRMPSSA